MVTEEALISFQSSVQILGWNRALKLLITFNIILLYYRLAELFFHLILSLPHDLFYLFLFSHLSSFILPIFSSD